MKRIAIWIDHKKAHILEYDVTGAHEKTHTPELHGKVTAEHLRRFYHDLAKKLKGSDVILVLGPGQAKDEFRNHCEEHDPQVAKAIKEVQTMKDHATLEEILKVSNTFFKKYFEWTAPV